MKLQLKASAIHLVQFLRSPKDCAQKYTPHTEKMRVIFSFLTLGLLISLLLLTFLSALENLLDLNLGNHAVEDILKKRPFLAFLIGILFAPFFEELIFRSWITFRRAYPALWVADLICSVSSKSKFQVLKQFKAGWNMLFPFIFYFSAVVFAMVHASNFENFKEYLWLTPIFTLPQLLLGLIFGYIRIKLGLVYSFIIHALHNFIIIGPYLIFS